MLKYETDFYQVSLDESHQVAILFWKREVTLPEFQEGCLALREVMGEHCLIKCIINATYKEVLTPEAEEWLKNSIFSKEWEKLSSYQVAFVMTEEKYQEMVHDYSLLRASHKNLPLELNYFTSLDEALHWLVHEQAMLT